MSSKPKSDVVDFPKGGTFGECPCGQPVHSIEDFRDKEILIEGYENVPEFKNPVVIVTVQNEGKRHKFYTFSSVVQSQLQRIASILQSGRKVRAVVTKEKRYYTLTS